MIHLCIVNIFSHGSSRVTVRKLRAPGLGRSTVRACYCPTHGGSTRALERARNDWRIQAPDCVGDDEAVFEAGTMTLDSTHTHATVRHEGWQRQPESWRLRLADYQLAALREAGAWELIPTNGRAYQTTKRSALPPAWSTRHSNYIGMPGMEINLLKRLDCLCYLIIYIPHKPSCSSNIAL